MQSCVVSSIQKCWNEVKNENGFCLNTRGRGKPWGATRQTAGLWEAHASVFSAVSPQGDGARGCRDAKSRAGLQGAAWMSGPILILVSLATSLIHLSRNHDRQTMRCLGPDFLWPALRRAERSTCAFIRSPSWMQPLILPVFSDYLLCARTAQGVLFLIFLAFYSWMNDFCLPFSLILIGE